MSLSTASQATVGVVGAGAVGQAVAATLVGTAVPRRLLIVSRTTMQTDALARDLDDMRQSLKAPVRPYAARLDDLRDCDAVIVALRAKFINSQTQDVRMAGLQANALPIRMIAEALGGYSGAMLVVTNPVDLMSRLLAETSGCPRVYGIGSNLDSARYRLAIAQMFGVPAAAVHGHVIGEHGDGAVICAASTTVDDRPVKVPLDRIRQDLAARPGHISAGVGRTRAGPAGAVLATLRKVLGLADGVEELSTAHHGGWLGIPLDFRLGTHTPRLPVLDADEVRAFAAADGKLRTAYQALCTDLPPGKRTS